MKMKRSLVSVLALLAFAGLAPCGTAAASGQEAGEVQVFQAGSSARPLTGLSKADLEREKLLQEVRRLERENRDGGPDFWQRFSPLATLITTLVAILGAFVTLWRQIDERRSDRRQALDGRFASLVSDLGSERLPVQAGAAVGLLTFLRDEYRQYHEQVFLTLLANLRLEHKPAVNRLLVEGFERALPLWLDELKRLGRTAELDLAHCHLPRADLSDLDLSQISELDLKETCLAGANLEDLPLVGVRGFGVNLCGARLSRADLSEARIHEAKLEKACLHNTRLVSAKLKDADLRNAKLQQALLQSAHLEGAKLGGAQFPGADLNDAFFKGAELDDAALRSILRAKNWDKAHFDSNVRARLEEMSKPHAGPAEGIHAVAAG